MPEDPRTFMITSPVLLEMQNVSEKGRGENQNIHFMFNNTFPKTRAIYEILWKNTVEPEATDDAIQRMCIACWTTTARKNTENMEYLLLFHGARGRAVG